MQEHKFLYKRIAVRRKSFNLVNKSLTRSIGWRLKLNSSYSEIKGPGCCLFLYLSSIVNHLNDHSQVVNLPSLQTRSKAKQGGVHGGSDSASFF